MPYIVIDQRSVIKSIEETSFLSRVILLGISLHRISSPTHK